MNILGEHVDGFGVYGFLVHGMMVIFFVGAAFIAFLYCWKKGRLDMDEEPSIQMMQDDEKTENKK